MYELVNIVDNQYSIVEDDCNIIRRVKKEKYDITNKPPFTVKMVGGDKERIVKCYAWQITNDNSAVILSPMNEQTYCIITRLDTIKDVEFNNYNSTTTTTTTTDKKKDAVTYTMLLEYAMPYHHHPLQKTITQYKVEKPQLS